MNNNRYRGGCYRICGFFQNVKYDVISHLSYCIIQKLNLYNMTKITYETLQPKTVVTYIPYDKCITFGDMLNILNGVNNENAKWLTVSFSNPSNYYMDLFELESSLARINFTENGNSKLNESVGYFPYMKSEQNSLIGRVVATSTNVISFIMIHRVVQWKFLLHKRQKTIRCGQ